MDSSAPDLWFDFCKHKDPEEFYGQLDSNERTLIDAWIERRSFLLRARLQQEIDSRLDELEDDFSQNTPFVRVLVRSVNYWSDAIDTSEEGLLTVWHPTDEQLELLEEGHVIQVKNLGVGNACYDGRIQFNGNGRTLMSVSSVRNDLYKECGRHASVARIHLLSRRLLESTTLGKRSFDVDLFALILKATKNPNKSGWIIYTTDISGLLLRVECHLERDVPACLQPLANSARENLTLCTVVFFRHVRVLPFDDTSGCAVVQFQKTSTVTRTAASDANQGMALNKWVNSSRGGPRIGRLAARLDANLLCHADLRAGTTVAVGVMRRLILLPDELLLVDVDCCGEDETQTFKFPLALLPSFVKLCGSEAMERVILNEREEVRLSCLTNMGAAFRFRHYPLRFSVQRQLTHVHGFPHCHYEVLEVSKVDTEALAAYYLSLE